MKKGDKVEIKKLKAVDNPVAITPKMEDYYPGQDNGNVSIPCEYTVVGVLQYDIQRGACIFLARESRNGVKVDGVFRTSPVVDVGEHGFTTTNSVYQVRKIEDDGASQPIQNSLAA